MPRRALPVEKIINLPRETEVFLSPGESLEAIYRKLSITHVTYYRWRKIYGGMRIEQAKQLKELERENVRLKQLVGDLSLEQCDSQRGGAWKLSSPAKRCEAVGRVQLQLCSVLRSSSGRLRIHPCDGRLKYGADSKPDSASYSVGLRLAYFSARFNGRFKKIAKKTKLSSTAAFSTPCSTGTF